jgi:hypothetical protein
LAKLSRHVGQTSQIFSFFALDTASTTGAGKTGLTSASFACYYKINTGAASVLVTLDASSGVTLGTYEPSVASHGAVKEIDATNMPGLYEYHAPNNGLASGDEVVFMLTGTGIRVAPIEIELTATNNQDGVHGGMSALPNTACTTNASLLTSGSGADQLSVASGKVILQATQAGVTIPTVTTVTNQLTAAAIATGVWQDSTAGDFTTASSIGKSLYTTGNAPGAASGLALVGSNMGTVSSVTGAVGSVTAAVVLPGIPANWITAAGINAGALNGKGDWLLSSGYTTPPTVAQIATAIFTDLMSSSDMNTAGSFGALVKADLNAPVGSIPTTPLLASNVPANFAALGITASGHISIVDTTTTNTDMLTAAAVWAAATRRLTDGTNIVLAKGVGITGFNDIAAGTQMDLVNAPNATAITAFVTAYGVAIIEGTVTRIQAERAVFDGAAAGQTDGGGTATFHVKSADGAKTRVTASTDGSGNRTAITLGDLS